MNAPLPTIPDIPIPQIAGGNVHKLRIPLGRTVADNGCAYDVMDIIALCLEAPDGTHAWGYACATPVGFFKRTGWWIRPTPSEDALRQTFFSAVLPDLRTKEVLREAFAFNGKAADILTAAIRMALWDLASKSRSQSVAALLAGLHGRLAQPSVPCYGSTLDFALTDDEACQLACEYVRMGIEQIKVKTGAPNVRDDIRRLRAIREAVGDKVALTADSNEVWDAATCLSHMAAYQKEGIELAYIEDPLPRDDWDGYAELRVKCPVPVAAHDYFTELAQYERAAQARLFDFFRSGQDAANQLSIARLGLRHGIPIYYGNSIMEHNVQAAAALPGTVMLEFSALGWWQIAGRRPRIEHGREILPDAPGYGFDPDPDALAEFHYPQTSETIARPCPFPEKS